MDPSSYGKVLGPIQFQSFEYVIAFILLMCLKSLQLLEKVGFADVDAEDRTEQFINVLTKEKERTVTSKDELLKVCVFCIS